ncbi:MAG: transcriptional repressor [Deltaproteobacteria bacterium]|nr:transcriptional repressor [Deltaproteobacteria bacterium]
MKDLTRITRELNKEGFRVTRIRKAMLEVFLDNHKPVSAEELMDALGRSKLAFNRTTVYRELNFLTERALIKEVRFLHERAKRYEAADLGHHHHLICVSCKKVEDIELKNDLDEEEKRIYRSTGFKVLSHALEFMGICQGCR